MEVLCWWRKKKKTSALRLLFLPSICPSAQHNSLDCGPLSLPDKNVPLDEKLVASCCFASINSTICRLCSNYNTYRWNSLLIHSKYAIYILDSSVVYCNIVIIIRNQLVLVPKTDRGILRISRWPQTWIPERSDELLNHKRL